MGLGKNNDGIAKPLQVKKRTKKLGLGHESAKDYSHWWDFAYNNAVKNTEVVKNEVCNFFFVNS